MIRLICNRLTRPIASTRAHGRFFSSSPLKPTSDSPNSTDPQPITPSYLLNSCGLSSESAISASEKLQFGTTCQSDSVLKLLRSIGLSQTHIANLITKRPLMLLADPVETLKPNVDLFGSLGFSGTKLMKVLSKEPRILEADARATVEFFGAHGFSEQQIYAVTVKCPRLYLHSVPKNLKPKLEYFKCLGFKDAEIAQMLSSEPYILGRSLENQIIPSIEIIRRVLGTDDDVLKAIKACYLILEVDLEKAFEQNIATLMNHGVPKSLVLKLIRLQPRSLVVRTCQFAEVVKEVEKLGFDPTNLLYILAVRSLAMMSKSLWERKWGVYCSFGMSEDQILSAFKLNPMCMITSEKKIRKMMGFFVNELKLKPSIVSKNPTLMLLSLEKRIVPRCSVLQLLMSKGIINGEFSLLYAIKMTHNMFEEKYVSKYKNVIPGVVEAHQGKIQFQGFPLS